MPKPGSPHPDRKRLPHGRPWLILVPRFLLLEREVEIEYRPLMLVSTLWPAVATP